MVEISNSLDLLSVILLSLYDLTDEKPAVRFNKAHMKPNHFNGKFIEVK